MVFEIVRYLTTFVEPKINWSEHRLRSILQWKQPRVYSRDMTFDFRTGNSTSWSFLWLSSAPPGKCRYISQIRRWPCPCNNFKFISTERLAFYAVQARTGRYRQVLAKCKSAPLHVQELQIRSFSTSLDRQRGEPHVLAASPPENPHRYPLNRVMCRLQRLYGILGKEKYTLSLVK